MLRRYMLPLLLATGPFARAQVSSDALTVTATRPIAQQSNQLEMGVNVSGPLSMGLDSILPILSPAGITAANLIGAGSSLILTSDRPGITWNFNLTVPFTKLQSAITALQTISKNNPALELNYYTSADQSAAFLQQACPVADLVADAKAQAKALADTSGVFVGPVTAISDGGARTAAGTYGIPIIGVIANFRAALLFSPPAAPSSCTIIVKFSLLH